MGTFCKIERNRPKIDVAEITYMEPNRLLQSFHGDFAAHIKVYRESGIQ